jgi:hypothetical protein
MLALLSRDLYVRRSLLEITLLWDSVQGVPVEGVVRLGAVGDAGRGAGEFHALTSAIR